MHRPAVVLTNVLVCAILQTGHATMDRRKALQVGGAGEGNLPRMALTTLDENETFLLLTGAMAQSGEFVDARRKQIWRAAIEEFALPYCPWTTSKGNTMDEASDPRQYISPSDLPRAVAMDCMSSETNRPDREVVPRLARFQNVKGVVECWRRGVVNHRKCVNPIFKIATAELRKTLWGKRYSDNWWKKEGHKQALGRLKKVVLKVISFSNGLCKGDAEGKDEDWEKAIVEFSSVWKDTPLSKIK